MLPVDVPAQPRKVRRAPLGNFLGNYCRQKLPKGASGNQRRIKKPLFRAYTATCDDNSGPFWRPVLCQIELPPYTCPTCSYVLPAFDGWEDAGADRSPKPPGQRTRATNGPLAQRVTVARWRLGAGGRGACPDGNQADGGNRTRQPPVRGASAGAGGVAKRFEVFLDRPQRLPNQCRCRERYRLVPQAT